MNFREAQQAMRAGEIPTLDGACRHCKGWGYTTEESPTFRAGQTIEQGSGCPRCRGNGVDPEWVDGVDVQRKTA